MIMQQVTSGHIAAIGFEDGTIEVHYKSGQKYRGSCTTEQHAAIMAAKSHGAALAASGLKLVRITE